MIINTARFGEIPVDESKVITMAGPILGFEQLDRFILIVPGHGASHGAAATPCRYENGGLPGEAAVAVESSVRGFS